jgi:hypothetical protein
MAPFIQSANVTVSGSGITEIVENPYALISEAALHGQQRGSVVRIHSFNVQNQNAVNPLLVTWQDSNFSNLAGPFYIPAVPGNWTERATPPGFLFETTRNSSSGVGFDLNININAAQSVQVFCEYSVSFAPGRVAG